MPRTRWSAVPADMWKSTPLCMAQYRRLFGAHRKAVAHDADEMKVCKVSACGGRDALKADQRSPENDEDDDDDDNDVGAGDS